MPTYKNVSNQAIEFVTTGHMEPGEVKSLADVIDHPDLERVDDQELATLTATEPTSDEAPTTATLEQPAAPAALPAPAAGIVLGSVPAAQPQAPQQNVNNQGA